MIALTLVLAAALAADAGTADCDASCIEASAWANLRSLPGGRALQPDDFLAAAARAAATASLEEGTDLRPADGTAALERAGNGHPSPQAVAVRGPPAKAALRAAELAVEAAGRGKSTHAGFGAALGAGGRSATLFVILARERAQLEPLPPRADVGSVARVAGRLVPEVSTPQLLSEAPGGEVQNLTLKRKAKGGFEGFVALKRAGRWRIEVTAQGPRGPEIVALWRVQVGGAEEAAAASPPDEPPDANGPAVLVDQINALRAERGAPPLAPDPALAAVAHSHSALMRKTGQFGHTLYADGDLTSRLRAAAYPFARAGENVAQAAGVLAAHRATVESPAHLANLIDPEMTHVGVGIARAPDGLYVTEVLARRVDAAGDLATRALAAVNAARAGQGLPPLVRDATLDAFAKDHLSQAIAAERPGVERDEGGTLHDLVLERTRAGSVAVDIFVGTRPEDATGSKNLIDKIYRTVGVAAVVASTPKFGTGRLWLVLIYAEPPRKLIPQ